MSDGVGITAGAGTTIATDDVGPGTHYQRVKLTPGGDGAAAYALTKYKLIGAATTNATSVKASAAALYGWHLTNSHASAWRYLKLYNKASAPTVGTDVPDLTLGIPPAGGAVIALAHGIDFATGLALAITTGSADNDSTAPAADTIVNLFYV